jgi:tRNA(fMet)-specific endonuclease VapC
MALLVLDTDHFSEWERASAAGGRLRDRLVAAKDNMAISIITVEEQMRGWLAEINRRHDPRHQIEAYAKLQQQIDVFAEWLILPWEGDAASLFLAFRRRGLRLGSMDLKIACVTLARSATLLTRNAKDFRQVPGLQLENWLD